MCFVTNNTQWSIIIVNWYLIKHNICVTKIRYQCVFRLRKLWNNIKVCKCLHWKCYVFAMAFLKEKKTESITFPENRYDDVVH